MSKTYYGHETAAAVKNFPITKTPVHLAFIYAMAQIKIAAADANLEGKQLSIEVHDAICMAAQEVLDGKLDDQFITDQIQGGAGTSMHMNINEVIAARAQELLDEKKSSTKVHYLDHVNLAQSTNDVVPTAIRIVLLQQIDKYLKSLDDLSSIFEQKGREFSQVLKVGRTHLQDAVPMTLGQEFLAYASFVKRDQKRLIEVKAHLLATNMGGTAIGTGVNASKKFVDLVNKRIAKLTGYAFVPAIDLIDATQNVDPLMHAAYLLQLSAIGLSKICSDLRLLASGPKAGLAEINLPALQKGSTIMPGKVNPVILEVMSQISFQASGNTLAASLAMYHGQLELNVMLPVFMKTAIETTQILTSGVEILTVYIKNTTANETNCAKWFSQSYCTAAALTPIIGYDKVAELVNKSLSKGSSFLDEVRAANLISEAQLQKVLNPHELTKLK